MHFAHHDRLHFHTLLNTLHCRYLQHYGAPFSSELLHLHWVWRTLKRPGKSWEGYYQRNIIYTFNISVHSENFIILFIQTIWFVQQGATSYDGTHTDRALNTVQSIYCTVMTWNLLDILFLNFYSKKYIK